MVDKVARVFFFTISLVTILGGIYFLVMGDYFRGFLGLVSGMVIYNMFT